MDHAAGRGGCWRPHGIGRRQPTALDGRNALADQVARAAKVHLHPISGASNLQKEIRTKTYILSKLFGATCPLAEGYTSVVTWINENFASFER